MNEILILAVCAYVYSIVLTEGGMIFNRWFTWAEKRLPGWLFNPVVGCVYCVAGQMSLWYYIYKYWNNYDIFEHVGFVCLTIFFVKVITTIKNNLKYD